MALYLFRDFMNDLGRPSRLLDQHFGMGLTPDDLMAPLAIPSRAHQLRSHYQRPWRTESRDSGSTLHIDKNNFRVELDVQQFAPEEVTVKVTDDCITVEASHEEKQDEHGFISRKFVRRYVVPQGFDVSALASSLSSDGVLSVTAPKMATAEANEKSIPISHTGQPHRAVKQKEDKMES